jgi:hypothetical protein
MEKSPSAKLQFIVGDIGYAFNNDIGIFYDFIGKINKSIYIFIYYETTPLHRGRQPPGGASNYSY